MRTFAQKQNQSQKPVSSILARPNIGTLGLDHRVHSIRHPKRTLGNQAVCVPQTDVTVHEAGLAGMAEARFGHDFSLIPIHPLAAEVIRANFSSDKTDDEHTQKANQIMSSPSADNTAGDVAKRTGPLPQRQIRDGGQAGKLQGDAGSVQVQGGNVAFLLFLNSGSGVTGGTLGPVGAGGVYGNGVEIQFSIPQAVRRQYRNIRPTQWSGTEAIWVRSGAPLMGKWQIHRQGPGTGLDDPLAPNIVSRNDLVAYYDSPGPDVFARYLLHNPPARVYAVQNFTGWIIGEPVTGGGAQRLCPVVAWYSIVDLANVNWENPGKTPQWQRLGDSRSGQGWAATNTPPPI